MSRCKPPDGGPGASSNRELSDNPKEPMMFNPRNPLLTDVGLLLLRLVVGVVFIYHGGQKLFGWWEGMGMKEFTTMLESLEVPMPGLSAWCAALAEFGGGILVLIGAFTRLAAIPIIVNMAVAVFVVHRDAFNVKKEGMEYALTLGVVLIAILLSGPGRFSFDRLGLALFRRKPAVTETK